MTTKDDNKRDAGRPNESVCQDEWLDDEDSHTHQVKCSLCGTVTNVTPDSYELERCTACGYVARNLATGNESIKEVVASDAYRTQLYDATMSETARYCLCEAMIAVAAGGSPTLSASLCEYAARVCEENGDLAGASACYRRAADGLARVINSGGHAHVGGYPTDCLVLAGFLRRCGEFETAASWLRRGWEVVLRDMLHNLVSYLREHDRIRSGDTRQERRSIGSTVDSLQEALAGAFSAPPINQE